MRSAGIEKRVCVFGIFEYSPRYYSPQLGGILSLTARAQGNITGQLENKSLMQFELVFYPLGETKIPV